MYIRHAGENRPDEVAGEHLDDTLGLWPMRGRLAVAYPYYSLISHQTSVMYVQVPKDMEGGYLVLHPKGIPDTEEREIVMHPKENTIVSFRGDCLHRVVKFASASGRQRISLVLEQYVVPKHLYWRTQKFWCSNEI